MPPSCWMRSTNPTSGHRLRWEYLNQDEVPERFESKMFAFLQRPVAPRRPLAVVGDAASANLG